MGEEEDKKCAISLFCNEDKALRLLASAMVSRKEAECRSTEEIFEYVYRLDEYRRKLEENGGKASYRYWDASLNKEVILPERGLIS